MGQYWIIVNEDKEEFIHPHVFGDGLKLLEFGCRANGTLTGLTLLLIDKEGNGRGGGDFYCLDPTHPKADIFNIIGRWHGDRIKIVGDYGDKNYYDEKTGTWTNLYDFAQKYWRNISQLVLTMMIQDQYIREHQEKTNWRSLVDRLKL